MSSEHNDHNDHKNFSNSKKKEYRKEFLSMRNSIDKAKKAKLDEMIVERLASLPEIDSASVVMVYAPFRGEIDLVPLFDRLYLLGKKTAFPKCKNGGEMRFYICEYASLSKQAYGILEPTSSCEELTDLTGAVCIIPCLAASVDGYRLGYGGGYYDRFLEKSDIKKIVAVYDRFLLKSSEDIRETHDIPADIIITEKGEIRI